MFFNLFKKNSASSILEPPVSEGKIEAIAPVPPISPFKHSQVSENPLMSLSETALRDLCRHRIDAFESWSRRLIDETLKIHILLITSTT